MGVYLGKTKVCVTKHKNDPIENLVSENIKGGVEVGGVAGKASVMETENLTATASDIVKGKTAAVNGQVITGTVPVVEAKTYTPGRTDQQIINGQYLVGVQTIKGDANLLAGNIKKDVSIFGITGTYDNSAAGASFTGYTNARQTGTSMTAPSRIKAALVYPANRYGEAYADRSYALWLVGVGAFINAAINTTGTLGRFVPSYDANRVRLTNVMYGTFTLTNDGKTINFFDMDGEEAVEMTGYLFY